MTSKKTSLNAANDALKPAFVSAIIMSIFINLTMFVIPIYSMQIYDRVLSSRSTGTLVVLTLIAVAFIALYGLLEYTRRGAMVRASARYNDILLAPLLDVAFRAQLAGGETRSQQALRDAETVREGIASGLMVTLFDIPWSIVFIGMCYLLHPLLGNVALAGALVIAVCALVNELLTRAGLEDATRHVAERNKFAQASLRNAESIHGLGMGKAITSRWRSLDNSVMAAHCLSNERSAALLGFSKGIRLLVQIALMGTGAWLAITREISPGAMIAAMIIMGRALAPIEQAVASWKRIAAYRSAQARLKTIFAQFPEREPGTKLPSAQGKLSVENLFLVPATGGEPIVRNANFAIEPGTVLAVIGPSGGGKSSLVRALAGVWSPAKGAVRLDAASIDQWEPSELGKQIGYLPQEVEFLPASVAENIGRLGATDDEEVVRAAKIAGVHDTILKLPKGYETPVGDGGVVLSGGQRQRLALARALYGAPCLVILDEPNSNLDGDGEAALARAIQSMKANGQTVVIVTHKPQVMRLVDKVLVLVDGVVTEFGDRDVVMPKLTGPRVTNLPNRGARQTPAQQQGAARPQVDVPSSESGDQAGSAHVA